MRAIVVNLVRYISLRVNLAIYILAFAIPFIIEKPQLLTGTIVNSLIYTASEKLDRKSLYPVLFLPSLSVLLHGVLFGRLTIFLLYFIPFIWLGNYLQVSIFSINVRQKYLFRVFFSASVKCCFLYFTAYLYHQLNIVPKMFVTSMGLIQFITASLGGLLSYFIIKTLERKINERS